jgi:hypothetical protein
MSSSTNTGLILISICYHLSLVIGVQLQLTCEQEQKLSSASVDSQELNK